MDLTDDVDLQDLAGRLPLELVGAVAGPDRDREGIDALAVAIGTSHGAYKFSKPPTGDVLAMELIEEIHRRLPETHLVMHGSSSVPKELVDEINAYGGEIPPTWGVPV